MGEHKLNRRVQYTRTALREALIDLICEEPLASISVTDICARADINRSTFYTSCARPLWIRSTLWSLS